MRRPEGWIGWPIAIASTVVMTASALGLLLSPAEPARFVLLAMVVALFVAVLAASPRWAAVAAMALGVLGTSVGVARGLRHLIAGHADALAWLCVAGALAGLFLVVLGCVHLLAGWRWWWRVLAVPAVLLLTVLGVYTLAIPMAATDPPRAAVTADPPAGWREVSFPARDGVQLQGWYTQGGNRAAVVVVPGSGSSRSGAAAQAEILADNGYGVLVYDPRGHGGSQGTAMDLGWAGDDDVAGAVDFLEGRGFDQVGALGLSMGGEQVLGAAAADSRIEAVVAEGATNRTAADYYWLSEEFGWRGSAQRALNAARYALVDALAEQGPPTPLAQAVRDIAPRPVLLIAAGTVPDEPLAARYFAQDTNTQVWVIETAGHTGGLSTDPQAWTGRVVGFFDEALDP